MTKKEVKLLQWSGKAALWLLLAPVLIPLKLHRWTGRLVGGWVLATRDSTPCPGCGETVSLVGRWQCGWCDYVFDGFAFARCEICGAVPPFIDCQACGASVRNPTLSL